jgi:hypothetical protein
MFVIYSNADEILVTTHKLEDEMLKEWFSVETGRSLDEYDRVWSSDTAVGIKASTRLA